jgi:Putative adhesin
VEVRGQDGDIHTREPITVTESFTASTADGDIDVRFAEDPPPHIDATTRDGDITISLPPPGPYLVHAQSGNGDATVRVPETTDPARAATEITARSDDGDVVIDSARSGRMPSR